MLLPGHRQRSWSFQSTNYFAGFLHRAEAGQPDKTILRWQKRYNWIKPYDMYDRSKDIGVIGIQIAVQWTHFIHELKLAHGLNLRSFVMV